MKLLNGEELVLTYNLGALCDLEAEFDGLENISDTLNETKHALRTIVKFIRIGMNGTIRKQNGLDGGHRPLYTDDTIAALIDREQIPELRQAITDAINRSNDQTFKVDEPATGKKE